MKYQEIQSLKADEIELAISRNLPSELLRVVLSAALYGDDPEWAEDVCARLACHKNENVRGNAILGFGHIARIHRRLTELKVRPLIESALQDNSEYVRGQAQCAIDDIGLFLEWRFDT